MSSPPFLAILAQTQQGNLELGTGTWALTLVLFCLSGAVESVLAALQYADVLRLMKHDRNLVKWNRLGNLVVGFGVSGLGGVGGAIAALFLMLADDKIKPGHSMTAPAWSLPQRV